MSQTEIIQEADPLLDDKIMFDAQLEAYHEVILEEQHKAQLINHKNWQTTPSFCRSKTGDKQKAPAAKNQNESSN